MCVVDQQCACACGSQATPSRCECQGCDVQPASFHFCNMNFHKDGAPRALGNTLRTPLSCRNSFTSAHCRQRQFRPEDSSRCWQMHPYLLDVEVVDEPSRCAVDKEIVRHAHPGDVLVFTVAHWEPLVLPSGLDIEIWVIGMKDHLPINANCSVVSTEHDLRNRSCSHTSEKSVCVHFSGQFTSQIQQVI